MMIRFIGPLGCMECGWQLLTAAKPYDHLAYCVNKECSHHGEFIQIPCMEAKPGKAVPLL